MHSCRTLISLSLVAWAALASCASNPGVMFATDPPGARVLIDGRDSGFVTPCHLALDNRPSQEVELILPGYIAARRILTDDVSSYTILWKESIVSSNTWHFPLWLPIEDFFMPVKRVNGPNPTRLFVRLRREADQ
jgi:hypothetical protein